MHSHIQGYNYYPEINGRLGSELIDAQKGQAFLNKMGWHHDDLYWQVYHNTGGKVLTSFKKNPANIVINGNLYLPIDSTSLRRLTGVELQNCKR